MRKFRWRLQRLLDVKVRQEDALRSDLMAITEQAVGVRSQIMVKKAALRTRLDALKALKGAEKLAEQEFFHRYAHVTETQIKQLQEKLAEIEERRKSKMAEVMEVRKFRKGLEKLRAKAEQEHKTEQQRLEQIDSDDKTTISYARKIIQSP